MTQTTGEDGPRWVEPFEGFEYQTKVMTIDAAFQREKLSTLGIEHEVFGDAVDPSFFVSESIQAGIKSGISAEGNVNILQELVIHRPAKLGEPLTLTGQIVKVTPVPRGRTIHTEVLFAAADGAPVIQANRISLKPSPESVGSRGAGERPAPLVPDVGTLNQLRTRHITPEQVKAFTNEGNSIHYEPVAAQNAGFRAPIIGGSLGVHLLMCQFWESEVLPRPGTPSFSAGIYFRRPVFWDERVIVGATDSSSATPPGSSTHDQVIALLKAGIFDESPSEASGENEHPRVGVAPLKVGTEIGIRWR